jgi:hypothetical protein
MDMRKNQQGKLWWYQRTHIPGDAYKLLINMEYVADTHDSNLVA